MNIAQKILKNFLSLLFAGIVTNLLGFVTIVYLARVLGPGDFGKISFAFAIVIYFTLIANLGLPLLGAREVARNRTKIKDYIGNILPLRLCLAFLGFGLLLLMALFLNKPLEIKYLILLYGLGLIPSALLLDWAFQGVEKMEYIGLGRILAGGVYLGLVFWFVKGPEQLLLIPCFLVASNLLVAGLLIFIFVRNFGKPRLKFDLISWKNLLKPALPIGLSFIMVQIFFGIDIVMLGFMRSNEEVGYYRVAYAVVMFLIMAGGAYFNAVFPLISNYYKTSLYSLQFLLSETSKLMVTMGLPLAVGGTILARPMMNLLYGAEYGGGIIAFQILIWAVACNYINGIYGQGLLACNRERKFLLIMTVIVAANLILNFILIPLLGPMGAAIATVSAEVVAFPLYYISFRKITEVRIHKHIGRPILSCIMMGLFLYWGLRGVNLSVFPLIAGGALVYFMSFFLMKGITREEVRLLISPVLSNKAESD